jgi:hypothetical protein
VYLIESAKTEIIGYQMDISFFVTIQQGNAVPLPEREVSSHHPLLFPGPSQAARERHLNSYVFSLLFAPSFNLYLKPVLHLGPVLFGYLLVPWNFESDSEISVNRVLMFACHLMQLTDIVVY